MMRPSGLGWINVEDHSPVELLDEPPLEGPDSPVEEDPREVTPKRDRRKGKGSA